MIRILNAQGKETKVSNGTLIVRAGNFGSGLDLGAKALDQAAPMMIALFGIVGPTLPYYGGLVKELSKRYHQERQLSHVAGVAQLVEQLTCNQKI